jgi:hypothetical protein
MPRPIPHPDNGSALPLCGESADNYYRLRDSHVAAGGIVSGLAREAAAQGRYADAVAVLEQSEASDFRNDRTPPARPSQHLAGPWVAVLSDRLRYVYPSAGFAAACLAKGALVDIAIVRGTALPAEVGGGVLRRRPQTWALHDVAYEMPALLSDNPADCTTAACRYEQARAMAAGLNARGALVEAAQLVGGIL